MADSHSHENVVPLPRRRGDRELSSWLLTIAEAQHRLNRGAAEIEAYVARASSIRADDKLRGGRDVRLWFVWLAAASIALLLSTVLSQSAAAALVGGGVVFAFGVAMHAHLSSVGHQRSLLARDTEFEALRDADIIERHDRIAYTSYRQLYAETFRLWRVGAFKDSKDLEIARDRVLDMILSTEALRVSHALRSPVTLTVIEDTHSQFVARRSSPGGPAQWLTRDMSCPHDSSLESVLDRYARFYVAAEFQVSGRVFYICALSEEHFTDTAKALIEGAATNYQAGDQIFRLLATNAEWASVLSGSNGDT